LAISRAPQGRAALKVALRMTFILGLYRPARNMRLPRAGNAR
jgi:hypothetical protein